VNSGDTVQVELRRGPQTGFQRSGWWSYVQRRPRRSRRPLLYDLVQVDPSLLTQRGSGSQEPEDNQRRSGQDASGDGGSRACSRRWLRSLWLRGG